MNLIQLWFLVLIKWAKQLIFAAIRVLYISFWWYFTIMDFFLVFFFIFFLSRLNFVWILIREGTHQSIGKGYRNGGIFLFLFLGGYRDVYSTVEKLMTDYWVFRNFLFTLCLYMHTSTSVYKHRWMYGKTEHMHRIYKSDKCHITAVEEGSL